MNLPEGLVDALVLDLMFLMFFAGAKKPARRDTVTGNRVLQFPLIFKRIAVICGGAGCLLAIVVMFVAPFEKPADPYIAGALLLFFAVCGAWLYVESLAQIEITPDGLSAWLFGGGRVT